MQYFIYVPDKGVIQQSFRTPSQAHMYNHEHHLGGTVVSEYQLEELRQEAQPQPRSHPQSSIIKRHYQPRESNMRVPVQPYYQQCAPNRPAPYRKVSNRPFKPHFVGKKKVIQ